MIANIGAIRLGFVLILFGALFSNIRVNAQDMPVKIVANSAISNTELTAKQIRRVFSMRQSSWPDGQPIRVFVLANDSAIHLSFCKRILRMFPYQIERTWNKFAYSGLADKPIVVGSEHEMLEKLKVTPGAIGYVGNTQLVSGVNQIKVLTE